MPHPAAARLDAVLARLPASYKGPGGAAAVISDGEMIARHTWGWANAERRIPFTPATLFRICSISKQFTCATLLDAFPDPSVLDADVRARLPLLEEPAPGALHLCHNQSGLRDYWAVAMLHGSPVEAPFGDEEAALVIGGTRTLHFAPGTRYSYCNQNFRILSDILQARTGRSFAELLRSRVFAPAGMASALLAADTRAMPDGTEGYEGTQATGFRAAENRVLWTGDAGIGASLDDMIAWERHIDATRDDTAALYSRLSVPVQFADGRPAGYGFGLNRRAELGRMVTGHGGALRGWRSQRLHSAADRLSVVVLFNHLSDAGAAAVELFAAALGEARPDPAPVEAGAAPDWLGSYIEPETGLCTRLESAGAGQVRLRYGHHPEILPLAADGSAGANGVSVRREAEGVRLARSGDNQSSILLRSPGQPEADIAGRYRNAELNSILTIGASGGALYGAFSGALGQGRMELLEPGGGTSWLLPCPRALDHTPPGDWTLTVIRDQEGRPATIMIGCWLARHLRYERIAPA